jgi:hypothetical protein
MGVQQAGQPGTQRAKTVKLGVDLGQPLAQQRLGVPTRALTPVGDLQELEDLRNRRPTRWAPLMNRSRPTAASS